MVYSDNEQFAKSSNCANWKEYVDKGLYPRKESLEIHRSQANSRINKWIGCHNVDVTSTTYTTYLRDLEIELIKRIHDKEKNRRAGQQPGIYQPHDYLYEDERLFLQEIGQALGYIKKRGII